MNKLNVWGAGSARIVLHAAGVGLFAALWLCSPSARAAGAVATDEDNAGPVFIYALVTGAASREDAGYAALAECRKNSGKHCKVIARFDQCGGYAASSSKKLYGVGWGDSSDIARSMALAKCGDASCRIMAVQCE